jgi:hypothetical protein
MVATAAVGYVVKRVVDGPVGRELGRYVSEVVKEAEATA